MKGAQRLTPKYKILGPRKQYGRYLSPPIYAYAVSDLKVPDPERFQKACEDILADEAEIAYKLSLGILSPMHIYIRMAEDHRYIRDQLFYSHLNEFGAH